MHIAHTSLVGVVCCGDSYVCTKSERITGMAGPPRKIHCTPKSRFSLYVCVSVRCVVRNACAVAQNMMRDVISLSLFLTLTRSFLFFISLSFPFTCDSCFCCCTDFSVLLFQLLVMPFGRRLDTLACKERDSLLILHSLPVVSLAFSFGSLLRQRLLQYLIIRSLYA